MGVALNMFSPDDQVKIGRLLARLEKNVQKRWEIEGHKNMIICVPPKASSYALCYVMFKNENAGRRREFMEQAASTALESEHVRTVIAIAKNIDRHDATYHAILLAEPERGSLG